MSGRNMTDAGAFYRYFLRNLAMPLGDRLFSQSTMHRLRFLEQAQWWSRERLQDERRKLLMSLIRTVYDEVPFYRTLMVDAGVCPRDIRDIEDLRKLPIVTKRMLREAQPEHIIRNTGYKTYDACSSGSTGNPFCIKRDSETDGWYRASLLLALEWSGWRIGDSHLQTGMTIDRPPIKRLKDWFLRCHYESAFDLRDKHLDDVLKTLRRHNLRYLWGYPGSLYFVARRAKAVGWDRPLDALVSWGDNLTSEARKTIESAFEAPVYDNYGVGEGVWVAGQCGHGAHYHIHMLDVIVEYVDDDGNHVPQGKPGNLLLTRLHPGPTPLVRYRVGDVGCARQTQTCDCGRNFEIMQMIHGRESDVVVTPSGNHLILHYFTGILEWFTQIDSFQVIQDKSDAITLLVVPTEKYDETVGQQIIEALHSRGAEDLYIEIKLVDEIPLTPGGKRRFVVNRLIESRN